MQNVFEDDESGRGWYWSWNGLAGDTLEGMVVFFPSQAAAQADFTFHCAAPFDGTGRRIRPITEIQDLINVEFARLDLCAAAGQPTVVKIVAVGTGTNWDDVWPVGEPIEQGLCRGQIEAAIEQLQKMYSVP